MKTIPCLMCETPFERKRRGPVVHYCRPCRVSMQRERARDRMARSRAQLNAAFDRRPAEVSVSARELAFEVATTAGDSLPVQADRMPPGSKSPLGSDDGRSTYFTILAGELDTKANDAARHVCDEDTGPYAGYTQADCGQCFWDREPHWCVNL